MTWDDLRYFLELVRHGRLSRVAGRLGVDRTTVARRIEQLERALGCRLFESTTDGYVLTEAGRHLVSHAEAVESSVTMLVEEATGQGRRVSGTVRVGAPEGLAASVLSPRLGPLLDGHPDLDVEFLSLPRFPSLAAREADIVVTLDPPQVGRYVVTRLTDFVYALFASQDYLSRHGAVASREQLADHVFVGYIDELLLSPQLRYLDSLTTRPRLRMASSGMLAQLSAVQAGIGLGVLAHYLAAGQELVRILPDEAVWRRTFWLATHTDGYRLRRVRAVWDFLRGLADENQALFLGNAGDSPRSQAVE